MHSHIKPVCLRHRTRNVRTMCASRKVWISCLCTEGYIYIYIVSLTAYPNPFRGTLCMYSQRKIVRTTGPLHWFNLKHASYFTMHIVLAQIYLQGFKPEISLFGLNNMRGLIKLNMVIKNRSYLLFVYYYAFFLNV